MSFLAQFRKEVMKMHPKGGLNRSVTTDIDRFYQFLLTSEHVYATVENIIGTDDNYEKLRFLDMERGDQLRRDLKYIEENFPHISNCNYTPLPQGIEYAEHLESLSQSPPEFLCHIYTLYFAHFSGGLIMGKIFSQKLFENHQLEFYTWDKDLEEIKAIIRNAFNEIFQLWNEKQQEMCTSTIPDTYVYNGSLLNVLFQ